jgi:hypothetical protein
MKELLVAILFTSHSLAGGQKLDNPVDNLFAQIEQTLNGPLTGSPVTGNYNLAIGLCATLPAHSNNDILFGAFTTAPDNVDGFVNIGNRWCGLRSTGQTVPCPPPVAEPCQ